MQPATAKQGFMDRWGERTNPSVVVLFSIQPMPLDFGNLYKGNVDRGITIIRPCY